MILVTDMDGTLADTRYAVEAAYRAAGVAYFPEGWWGRPAREWLPEETRLAVHEAKRRLYPSFTHLVRPLPALRVLHTALDGGYEVAIVTAASREAAIHVLDSLGAWRFRLTVHSEQSLDQRRELLWHYGRKHYEGIYLDDSPSNVAMAREVLPTWLVAQV